MKKHVLIGVTCLTIGLLNAVAFGKDVRRPNFVPGEILIKYRDNANTAAMSDLTRSLGSLKKKEFTTVRVQHLTLPSEMSVEQAIEYFSKNRDVEYAEPNYIVRANAMPDDPDMGQLWGLHNDGQSGNGMMGTAGADIGAANAWGIETGKSHPVVVAVIDTGVAYNHPDLKANIWKNPGETDCEDGVDDDENGYIDDCHGWDFIGDDNDPRDYDGRVGHGTHVAGTIAAVGNNGEGITGVMWHAQIMPALKSMSE